MQISPKSLLLAALLASPAAAQSYTIVDLGSVAGNWINPRAINDVSVVVGMSVAPSGALRPVRWEAGSAVDFGTLGGANGKANGINKAGDIVGSSDDATGQQRATRWTGAGPEDLNNLIAPGTGWNLTGAADINNLGEIIGTGTLGGSTRAYRLTPVLTAPRLGGLQPAISGTSAALHGLGFQPAATVFVIFGFAPGSTPIPGCTSLTAGISAPLILAATGADTDGRIELPVAIPAGIGGLTVLLQAVDPVACTVSELSLQMLL